MVDNYTTSLIAFLKSKCGSNLAWLIAGVLNLSGDGHIWAGWIPSCKICVPKDAFFFFIGLIAEIADGKHE